MRILHLIPTLKYGGAERQARQLLFALNEKGIDVALFSRVDAADAIELRAGGITVRPIHCKSNYHPQLLSGLATFVRDWKPHLIQTWMPMMDILGGIVALTIGIPFVISERSAEANYSERGKALARKFLGHGAAAVVANSPAGMDYWKGHPRLHLIPNGLDLDAIRVAAPGPRPLHRP
ncbi:glycosyltransferase, partial [Bradyrhizobium brasilense]|uniref:glycosyltransferase n=1 Tax=Bradyrhizobium brasilense TaxID=1419277 RepID=UPI00117786FB